MNIFVARLKCLLRNKGNLFWTFIFPCCLGLFFFFGFGRLSEDNILETTRIFVANEAEDAPFVSVMKDVMIDDKTPLFDVKTQFEQVLLEEKLENGEIPGYIFTKEDGSIVYRINNNGLSETITKSFLDQYLQVEGLILEVSSTNPSKIPAILADLENPTVYLAVKEASTDLKANKFIIYFYSLIAMACMYASFWGIGLVDDIQANMSPLGARSNITPTHKMKVIVIYFLAALLIHFVGNIILIAFLKYVLGVVFSSTTILIILSSLIGTISGIALGAFLSTITNTSYGKKEGMMTIITLVLSALSGLMRVELKYFIMKNLPFLGYINPASLLTDTFYSLYYYNDLGKYFSNLIILFIISIALLIGTYLNLRGKKYDSI